MKCTIDRKAMGALLESADKTRHLAEHKIEHNRFKTRVVDELIDSHKKAYPSTVYGGVDKMIKKKFFGLLSDEYRISYSWVEEYDERRLKNALASYKGCVEMHINTNLKRLVEKFKSLYECGVSEFHVESHDVEALGSAGALKNWIWERDYFSSVSDKRKTPNIKFFIEVEKNGKLFKKEARYSRAGVLSYLHNTLGVYNTPVATKLPNRVFCG